MNVTEQNSWTEFQSWYQTGTGNNGLPDKGEEEPEIIKGSRG